MRADWTNGHIQQEEPVELVFRFAASLETAGRLVRAKQAARRLPAVGVAFGYIQPDGLRDGVHAGDGTSGGLLTRRNARAGGRDGRHRSGDGGVATTDRHLHPRPLYGGCAVGHHKQLHSGVFPEGAISSNAGDTRHCRDGGQAQNGGSLPMSHLHDDYPWTDVRLCCTATNDCPGFKVDPGWCLARYAAGLRWCCTVLPNNVCHVAMCALKLVAPRGAATGDGCWCGSR
mmetsp:Transcript_25103/g.81174  ORF Transcript_25103/g.81174 Transcript_25103/m.81174 type:complete len:230 (-) Transcript_25103:246-935(-)